MTVSAIVLSSATMNRIVASQTLHPDGPAVTRAAEGMDRRAFTVDDVFAMIEAGIIGRDERVELIGGELVPMSPKGVDHEGVKRVINRFVQRAAPDDLEIAPETTLRLDQHNFVEPDFLVFRRRPPRTQPGPGDTLLAVEVADSSLAYDLGRKVWIYAAHGVPEVWVVNALTLVTRVHRKLGPSGYGEVIEFEPFERLEPVLAPALAVTLADLGLTPATD